jgi:hypothetical protein
MGLHLWVDGDQLRYKATRAVNDGLKDRIREHRRDIITLLKSKSTSAAGPVLPQWCNPDCPCLRRIEAAETDTVSACLMETDERNWKWTRIDKMQSCPKSETTTAPEEGR